MKPKIKANIKPLSDKRAEQNKEYLKLNKEFLKANPYCAVFPTKRSNQVHHKKGRIGKLLTNVRYFLAVSQDGHDYINFHIPEAIEKGWIVLRNTKN